MQVDMFNINDFIAANHCKEVTSPIFFQYDGTPTVDGLFSYEIFGVTAEERKNIFGYIDLHGKFIHPILYSMFVSRMSNISSILNGEKYAVIANKKITFVDKDVDGAETGLDFLYDHFDEIEWMNEMEEEEMTSIDKKSRMKLIKSLGKKEFFVDKWLVLPPYYRDQSSTNMSMGDTINKLYKELISRTRALKTSFSFEIFGNETKRAVQDMLANIYFATISPLSGKNVNIIPGTNNTELVGTRKNSLVRKSLLGNTIDWSASSVITTPQNNMANTVNEKPVPWGYCSIPLASVVSMFNPFFVAYLEDFFEDIFNMIMTNDPNISNINIRQFGSEAISKMCKRFIESPGERFSPISYEYLDDDGNKVTGTLKMAIRVTDEEFDYRNITMMDVMYMAASEIVKDKHAYVTRYPIDNFQSIFPARIKVLTTMKTLNADVILGIPFGFNEYTNDRNAFSEKLSEIISSLSISHYSEYPTIPDDYHSEGDSAMYDVTILGNQYISSMKADYDGDTIFMKPIFTKEANAEAERLIYAKTAVLDASGKLSRSIAGLSKEAVLGAYELTKNDPTA